MRFNNVACFSRNQGFTLVEIIIGIIVFSISLAIVSQLINPTEKNSADQIHQIKASELGQALMNDIMSRAFDEQSDMAGGILRCDEDQDDSGLVEAGEQCSDVMGPDIDETNRSLFDDVDDFNGYSEFVTATNTNLDGSYGTFEINVTVAYNGGAVRVGDRLAKQIKVVVTTPLGTDITFSVFRTNF